MAESFQDLGKTLLEAAVTDYKTLRGTEGPISGDTLDVTKKAGYAAVFTGLASGVGALFEATKGAPSSVVIATLAVAAAAIIAQSLIIRSDHAARAAVTAEMAQVVPKLMLAAHESAQTGGQSGTSGVPVAMGAGHPGGNGGSGQEVILVPPGTKIVLGDDTRVDLVAVGIARDGTD
ncbi:MAG: hypothetical protein QOK19_298 [Solirubrobacteraceae bacterium]|jgi:hypothetical protein|nr:hypothetical protein [Solirubrobacteraceae bacterium]